MHRTYPTIPTNDLKKGERMEKYITTERLTIRPITPNDVSDIHKYASDKSITMMMFLPNESLDEAKIFVEYAVNEWNKSEPNDREYVIIFNEKIIGGINLEYSKDKKSCEIGWTIHNQYRNKGFATEAANALLKYAFNTLKVDKITAHCDSKNIASEKVMKKLKMKLVSNNGTRYYPKTGITSGEYLYSVTKKEYEK